MATAREVGYFPEEAEARPGDRLLQASDRRLSIEYRPGQRDKPRVRPKSRSGSTDSIISYVENPKRNRKFISLWVFSLIVIGIAVMFLLGVCVGFYVRELQTDKPDFKKICGVDDADMMEVKQRDRLGGYHESLAYYIRAKGISDFVEQFGVQDPTAGDQRDRKLANAVLDDFRKYSIGPVSVEKYEVVVTSPDPVRPNELEVLYTNGSTLRHFVFESNLAFLNGSAENSGRTNSEQGDSPADDWKFPHVAFSPSGIAEGRLVYAHLGRETDLLVLTSLGVDLHGSVLLMRMGSLSVAEKVRNCELYGVKAALLYWHQGDTTFDLPRGLNSSSYVPYASAVDPAIDEASIWRPSIPCQTISADQAADLLTLNYGLSSANSSSLVMAPRQWQGSDQKPFVVGLRRENNTDTEFSTLRLAVYNKPKKLKIKNVISSIQSVEDPDSYVIIGAPRSSMPGHSEDAVVSTSILVQVARAFHHVHQLHGWLPRRGVRLVSWGGTELSNIGMIEMIRRQHHLLGHRMIAYFDLRNLMVGNETLEANIPASIVQLVKEMANQVPNPGDREQMLHMTWRNGTSKTIPLGRYCNGMTQYPFLDILGIPTVHLQYTGFDGSKSPPSLTLRLEQLHHFKFHLAVTRMLMLTMLTILDSLVLPFDLLGATQGLHDTIWQTSHGLQECSRNEHKFGKAMQICEQLERATKSFSDLAQHYLERKDSTTLLAMNGVSVLFDKLFVQRHRGRPRHLLLPVLSDGSLAVLSELCQVGTVTGDWNMTLQFHDTLTRALTEALESLHMGA